MGKVPDSRNEADLKACLKGLLASSVFARAERQKRLLRYLVSQSLAGKADQLKGYTIGIEVFDRSPEFDPAIDAIVRVQVGQLRAKLREYYEDEGREDMFRFELPKGKNAIRIVPQSQASSAATVTTVKSSAYAYTEASARLVPIEDKPSLAVLPFVNWSSDPGQEYFADGITEDLTTELSRLSGIFVISRHSAFVYKGIAKRAEEIAAELGVRYLLEGSVRRCDWQVRISAQLIDTRSGMHLWAERYDRELKDIFAVQDDVTRRIVDTLQIKLTRGESEDFGYDDTRSVEAYEMLLRGRERFFIFTRQSSKEAKTFFMKTLEIDPNCAAAHSWLARTYIRDWAFDWEHNPAMLETALTHARNAVEIDKRLPLAQAILGWVQLWRKQSDSALAAGHRAVALDPNNADARLFLSLTLSAHNQGKAALAEIMTGMRLNPHPSPLYLMALGSCHYVLRDYDQAIAAFERGLALTPTFTPNWSWLTVLYALAGRREESLRAREMVLQLVADDRGCLGSPFFLDKTLKQWHERNRLFAWNL
jgi:adenylate cyclase